MRSMMHSCAGNRHTTTLSQALLHAPTQVQACTGFAVGLFSGAELDAHSLQVRRAEPLDHMSCCTATLCSVPERRGWGGEGGGGFYMHSEHRRAAILLLQDRESKMAYLSKIIDVVSLVLGQPALARPSKARNARCSCF